MAKVATEEPEAEFFSRVSSPPPSPLSQSSLQSPNPTMSNHCETQPLEEPKLMHGKTLTPFRDEYDPYRVPPNFFYSNLHQKCRRVLQLQAKFDEDNEMLDDYCPCCNYPIEGELFPVSVNIRKLNELGEGFPLYYDMAKFLSGLMFLALLVSGMYCLVTNYEAGRISEFDENLSGHLILEGTLANFGRTLSPPDLQAWLHVICMWLLLAGYNILTMRHKRLKSELDVSSTTPSDYTVMLTNVPEVKNDSLKEFLEANGRPDGVRCNVLKLNFVYRVSALVEAKKKREALKEKLAMAEKKLTQELIPPLRCLNPTKLSVEEYRNRLQQEEEKIKQLEAKKHSEFTHVAFATFNQDEEAKSVIKYLDSPELRTTWDVISHIIFRSHQEGAKNSFQGHKIITKRAPEPSDIAWENIGVPKKTVYLRRAVTWTATLIVLALSLLAIFFSSNVKTLLRKVYGPSDVSISDTLAYNVLSFLPSIIVVAINVILTFIIKITSKLEKHVTITHYNTSVAAKMTLAMFLNTAIISLILHWGDFYSSKGLAAEIYNIMISNAIVQPLVYWINLPFLLQKLYRFLARQKEDQCLMTQRQANRLYEGPALDMPSRYATLMKTYLLTLVYAPMMPLSFFFAIIAMVVQYWVDKYMLLRVHARPIRLSHELDEVMLQVIPLGAIVYACSSWIFFAEFHDGTLLPGLVGVVTTVAYYFVPVKSIMKIIRLRRNLGKKVDPARLSETDKPYEDAAVDFVDDYDRLNPLTQEEGNEYWVNLILKKKGPEEAGQVRDALSGQGSKKILDMMKQKKAFESPKGLISLMTMGKISRKVVPALGMVSDEDQALGGVVNTSASVDPPKFLGKFLGFKSSENGHDKGRAFGGFLAS